MNLPDMKTSSAKAKASRTRRLWKLYGLTPTERQRIESFQKGHPIYSVLLGKHLGTDHCHRTGLIRGVLDFRINRVYGVLEKAFPKNTAEVLSAKKYGLIGQAKYKKKMVYGPPVAKGKKAA
jgi:hypothetical protein